VKPRREKKNIKVKEDHWGYGREKEGGEMGDKKGNRGVNIIKAHYMHVWK
jgi:hypothetical protein